MGQSPCQGRICQTLVTHLVARETGHPVGAVLDITPRASLKPVPLGALAGLVEEKALETGP